ncbi:MAG: hypothetical protein WC775_06085 [Patescibacteria group bacterium]|jgi:hypothetical protein
MIDDNQVEAGVQAGKERLASTTEMYQVTQEFADSPVGAEVNAFIASFMHVAEGNKVEPQELHKMLKTQNTGEKLIFVKRDATNKIIGVQAVSRMLSFSSVPKDHGKAVLQLADGVVHPDSRQKGVLTDLLTDALTKAPGELSRLIEQQEPSEEREAVLEQLKRPSAYTVVDDTNPLRDAVVRAFCKATMAAGWQLDGKIVQGMAGPQASGVIEYDADEDITIVSGDVGVSGVEETKYGKLPVRKVTTVDYEKPGNAFDRILIGLPEMEWHMNEPGYRVVNGADKLSETEAILSAARREGFQQTERAQMTRFSAQKEV